MNKYLKRVEKLKAKVMLECPDCKHMAKVPKRFLDDSYFLCSQCGVFCSNFQLSPADREIFEKLAKLIPNNDDFNRLYGEYMIETNTSLRIYRW